MIIAIEGIDKAGKQTQTEKLCKTLKQHKSSFKIFHFPRYNTSIGKTIKQHLHMSDNKRSTKRSLQALHCLYAANKWEYLYAIQEACQKYDVVIIDRYLASNIVYGVANGLDKKWLNNLEYGLPKANLTILLDISVEESFKRSPTARDKFEKNKKFLNKVNDQYHILAKEQNWKIINAAQQKQDVHKNILDYVLPKIPKNNNGKKTSSRAKKGARLKNDIN